MTNSFIDSMKLNLRVFFNSYKSEIETKSKEEEESNDEFEKTRT